jgi:hypothetical protein
MDAGIAIRPVSGAVASDYVRPASVPLQHAVATDLDPSQTVTAVSKTDNVRNNAVAAQDAQSRTYLVDPETRDVIMRVIDTRTHQVVRQVPDQALLRMRAYARALQRGETPTHAAYRADFAV